MHRHQQQQDRSTIDIPNNNNANAKNNNNNNSNNNNNNNNEDHHHSIRLLPRSGTGNSVLSISSATTTSTSSATTTPSSPKRPWNNYSNTIANWFALNNNNNNNNESSPPISTPHISSPISLPIQQQNHTGSSLLHPSINLKSSSSSSSSTSSSTTTPTTTTFQNDHHHDSSLSSPFDQPPSSNPLITPQLSGMTTSSQNNLQSLLQQQDNKKSKVINELLETEKIYCNDMIVLKEVYYDQANLLLLQNEDRHHHQQQPFSSSDIKIIFSNLLAIIEFETTFVDLLKDAISLQQDKNGQFLSIGMVFRKMMQQIDLVYCDYCKRHEDAVCRLQELDAKPNVQQFLKTCSEQLQGRTQSWDIGSMLIKPVQRVLKYPLLLKELLSVTSEDDPDYEHLCIAHKEIQDVADHINEIKRRKDIVEKIVGDKKKTEINVVHGINKRITRNAHRIRQVTGFAAEATQDTLFDNLYQQFEEQQEVIHQLTRDIQAWVRQVKDHFDNLSVFANGLEEVYSAFGGVRVLSMERIKEFTKMATTFSMVMSRELDINIRGHIYSQIDDFLTVFENPTQVIHKRAQKLLDYDRVRSIKERGETPDKSLQESADMYVSINAQLVEELPQFFKLTQQYFDIIVGKLSAVQSRFYQQCYREWEKLLSTYHHNQQQRENINKDTILNQYYHDMIHHVQPFINDILPLQKEQWDMVTNASHLSLTPQKEKLSSEGYFDHGKIK
ncbi:unnamed protein product [Cunninghamella echinulata]